MLANLCGFLLGIWTPLGQVESALKLHRVLPSLYICVTYALYCTPGVLKYLEPNELKIYDCTIERSFDYTELDRIFDRIR